MSIDETLAARGDIYGGFRPNADISQHIKDVISTQEGWWHLEPYQREALEMIAQKIARILNGDPNYPDNWHDIAGYATLVERELIGDISPTSHKT